MSHKNFGIGGLFGINTDSPPTPIRFGILQEVTPEFSFSEKELRGQYQFPESVARTGAKISFKAKFAQIQGDVFNSLFFGASIASGELVPALDEAHSVPASPTYTVTVTQGATFDTDLGVFYSASGFPLTRVTSGPSTGEYSVDTATGIYTFAAGDAGVALKFNYLYTSSAGGKIITITNQLMATVPTFKAVLASTFENKNTVVVLNACKSTKLSLPMKNDDFTIADFDFSAQADASNEIGKISVTDF